MKIKIEFKIEIENENQDWKLRLEMKMGFGIGRGIEGFFLESFVGDVAHHRQMKKYDNNVFHFFLWVGIWTGHPT